jgi:hypothetical protein
VESYSGEYSDIGDVEVGYGEKIFRDLNQTCT